MRSMISGRGLDISPYGKLSDSMISEDPLNLNTERILEERLDREQQLAQEVKYLERQLNEQERECQLANDKIQAQEEEAVDLRKQIKQLRGKANDLEDKLAEERLRCS